MRNYIILNGKNSNEINGLLIQELPPISKPQIRTEIEEIDGRDGDIVTKLGFAAYDKEISVGLYKDFDINEIIAYFNSEGTIVFSNEPDKYYNYQIIDQIDFERLVRYRTATIRMHCQPFKYSTTQGTITKDASDTVSDEGSNLVLENTAEAPFKRLDTKGNATQQTYSGKNLFNFEEFAADKIAGGTGGVTRGTATVSGNSITITATGADAYTSYASTYPPEIAVTPNTDMVLSWESDATSSNNGNVYVFGKSGSSTTAIGYSQAISGKYAFNTGTYSVIKFRLGVSTSGNSITYSNIQMETGSTPTSYEPYVGATPSPNPSYPQPVNIVTGRQVVTIAGKNLIEDTITNGTIDRAGKIGSNASFKMLSARVQEGQTYTITSSNGFVGGFFTSKPAINSVSYNGQRTAQTGQTIYTITAPITGWICFRADANDSTPQFELGSTATAYEAPNVTPYEINLGKNLAQVEDDTYTSGDFTVTLADGVVTGNGTASSTVARNFTTDWVPLQPGTYTVSANNAAINSNVRFKCIDKATNSDLAGTELVMNAVNKTLTFTLTEFKQVKFYARFGADTYSNFTFKPQVERGSESTSYAPYFTPIELCKIGTAQDYIWNDEGTWKIHKATGKYTFTGATAEAWYKANNAYNTAIVSGMVLPTNNSSTILQAFSNYYTMETYNDTYNGAVDYGMSAPNNNQRVSVRNKDCADATALSTWLSSHPTDFYYALATPTDTEITDSELIEQLEALAEAHSYKGRTHINATATGNNAPHIIAAEVGVDNESIVTNSGNINSKPVIKIYGSGNIGAYLNDIQILQIALGDEGYITIDTNLMEAYKDTLDNLKNRLVTGDYSKFSLKPGANKIHFSGTVTKYEISKYSRWL